MTDSATFAYRAARADGGVELGSVQASSREDATSALNGRGLFPIELTSNNSPTRSRFTLPLDDLALGLRTLASLLEAGLPLSRALRAFEDSAPPTWSALVTTARERVRQGESLSAALAEGNGAIPPIVIGILRAGEAASALPAAVRRAAELTEQSAATKAALRNALAYPIVLAIAGTASLALIVGLVLPRFEAILADLGQSLPPAARVVMAAASAIRGGWPIALAVAVPAAFAWRRAISHSEGRRWLHERFLDLPMLGAVRASIGMAQTATSLGLLLESRVPMPAAMSHAARASGDAALEQRMLMARDSVLSGARLWAALKDHRALSPTSVRLARAGEENGQLPTMLAHAGRLERENAERSMRRALRLLEPALIVGFGAMVALTAAALLQAIYTLRPAA